MALESRRFRRSNLILSCTETACSSAASRKFFRVPEFPVVGKQRATAREMFSKGVERDATSWFALGGVVHPCTGVAFRGAGLCEKQRLQSVLSAAAGRHF